MLEFGLVTLSVMSVPRVWVVLGSVRDRGGGRAAGIGDHRLRGADHLDEVVVGPDALRVGAGWLVPVSCPSDLLVPVQVITGGWWPGVL